MNSLGRHILVEYYDCNPAVLNDVQRIEAAMVGAADAAHATVINTTFHHFSPFGVSGVVVIQESHLAIHTWPEFGYAAVDLFTCGDQVNPWDCYKSLLTALEAGHGSGVEIRRGAEDVLRQPTETHTDEQARDAARPIVKAERNIWYTERDANFAQSYRHTGEMLFREQTPYQKVEVIDTYAYGKMLLLDGFVMTTEGDEYAYHEMIAHVPLLVNREIQNVLVIGGGDGGAVREIVKHPNVAHVTLVEIDEAVLRATREHLPQIAQALDHPKVDVRIEDGIAFVKNAADCAYDLIIIDSTDPVGPASGLFTEEFYRNAYRALSANGIMVTQSESPRFNVKVLQEIYALYGKLFGRGNVWPYLLNVPTYPSGVWSLAFCAKGALHPLENFDADAATQFCANEHLHYYNPEIHRAAFAIPNYVRELLATALS